MIDTFAIRCSILHLAFSGKLTEQIDTDGTAVDILNRISSSKSIAQTENVPYEIPDSWAWVKLSDLYRINPKVNADGATEAAFIPMERISGGFGRDFTYETQKWERASKNHTKFKDGDVAFAKITPCFENRKSFIAHGLPNGIGGGTTELIILRQKEMLPEYTYYLILDQRFINAGTGSYKGTVGQQRVQSDVIKKYLIPVPPYEEQKRIVNIVEQAFSIIGAIDEFQTLYSDNLTALRSKLINAAIQGKLTEQLAEDGTAEELYQKIQVEKQALIKSGKIKKEKPPAVVTEAEKPFEIPEKWKWVSVGDVCINIQYGSSKKSSPSGKMPVIRMGNIQMGKIVFDKLVYTSDDDEIAKYPLEPGDLLFNRTNSMELVGKTGIYKGDQPAIYAGYLVRVTPLLLLPDYLNYCMQSKYYWDYCRTVRIDSNGQSNINAEKLKRFVFPLPPLAEQRRIVSLLDQVLERIAS